ncbi:MAG: DUF6019 family protein [Clostridium sp.]
MWGSFGIIGCVVLATVLYYIISMAVEDGVLNALKKYDKLKQKENNNEE